MDRSHKPWIIALLGLALFGGFIGRGVRAAESRSQTAEALVKRADLAALQAYLATPGVDINDRLDDKALLDYAAEQDQLQVATYLIEHGARIDAPPGHGRNEGVTALHRAAAFDAVDVLSYLITKGAQVDSRAAGGATPLIYAASNGAPHTVARLIELGADVRARFGRDQSAFSEAVANGHAEIARLLLKHGARPDQHSVIDAAARGHLSTIELMMSQDLDEETKASALRFALLGSFPSIIESDRKAIVETLLNHGAHIDNQIHKAPNIPLMLARTPELVALLLDRGANATAKFPGPVLAASFACNPDISDPLPILQVLIARSIDITSVSPSGPSVLGCALTNHQPDTVEFLVQHGMDVNAPGSELGRTLIFSAKDRATIQMLLRHGANVNVSDSGRSTPLSLAIEENRADTALSLIEAGANVREKALKGGPLLHAATRAGRLNVVIALLDHGADLLETDASDDTALHVALASDQDEIARLLLDRGADVNARGHDGATPLHVAASRNNVAMTQLLLERHANPSARDDDRLPPAQRATAARVRLLFEKPLPSEIAARDQAACAEVAKQGGFGTWLSTPSNDASESPPVDLAEDWDFLSQLAKESPIEIAGHPYLLGTADGPVYLARTEPDNVEHVVCEFAPPTDERQSAYRVLSLYERLKARSDRDSISVSLESLKRPGIEGAQALLDASRRARDPVPLQLNSDKNVLGDAIEYRRDDLLAFYLEHGVDPNLPWLEHTPVDGVHTLPTHDAPLFTAVSEGTRESMQLLLDHGANPDAIGDYIPAPVLVWAVKNAPIGKVQLLLAYGASPDLPASSYGVFSALDELFDGSPKADAVAAAIHALLLHGADPNPWSSVAFQRIARLKHREDLLQKALAAPNLLVDTAWATEALAAPGYLDARAEAVVRDALTVRDSTRCDAGVTGTALQVCLPNALKKADHDLNTRYAEVTHAKGDAAKAIRDQQRRWLRKREEHCKLRHASMIQTGWLSYVLDDPSRATCVLSATLSRTRELERLVSSASRP